MVAGADDGGARAGGRRGGVQACSNVSAWGFSSRPCRFHNKAGCGQFHYFRRPGRSEAKALVALEPLSFALEGALLCGIAAARPAHLSVRLVNCTREKWALWRRVVRPSLPLRSRRRRPSTLSAPKKGSTRRLRMSPFDCRSEARVGRSGGFGVRILSLFEVFLPGICCISKFLGVLRDISRVISEFEILLELRQARI